MKKVSLKIPKGTKCKNGICEQDIELDTEIEIPEVKPFLQVQPTPELNFESENQPNAAQSTSRGTTAVESFGILAPLEVCRHTSIKPRFHLGPKMYLFR